MSEILDSPKYIPVQNKKEPTKERATFRNLGKTKNGFNSVWRTKALRIVSLITRFIIRLRTSTQQYKFKFMTPKIFKMVNDQCSDYEYYQSRNLVRKRMSRLESLSVNVIAVIQHFIATQLKLKIQL